MHSLWLFSLQLWNVNCSQRTLQITPFGSVFNPVFFFSSSSRVRNAFTRSRLLCNKLQLNVGHTSYAREVTHAQAMKIALRLGLMEISQVLTLRFNSLKLLPWGVGAVNFDGFSDSYAEHSWSSWSWTWPNYSVHLVGVVDTQSWAFHCHCHLEQ